MRVGGIGDGEKGGEWSVGGWRGRPVGDQEEEGAGGHRPHLALRLEFCGDCGGGKEARCDEPLEDVVEARSAKTGFEVHQPCHLGTASVDLDEGDHELAETFKRVGVPSKDGRRCEGVDQFAEPAVDNSPPQPFFRSEAAPT